MLNENTRKANCVRILSERATSSLMQRVTIFLIESWPKLRTTRRIITELEFIFIGAMSTAKQLVSITCFRMLNNHAVNYRRAQVDTRSAFGLAYDNIFKSNAIE